MNKLDEIDDFMKKFDAPFVVAIDDNDGNIAVSAHGAGRDMLLLITGLIRECVPKEHQRVFMASVTAVLEKLQKEESC